jgi:hypothetical protein
MALRRDDGGSNTAVGRPRRPRLYSDRVDPRRPRTSRNGIDPTASSASTLGGVNSEVRVSDAEREAVVRRLLRAVGEGRLDMDEFEERAAIAHAARTRADLEPLTSDLPRDLW